MAHIKDLWEAAPSAAFKQTYTYHNHTWRCKHAQGDAIDYVREAVAGGVLDIGISDHMPTPDGRWPEVRMALAEMPDYLTAIRDAQSAFPQARIRAGFECEYLHEHRHFFADELLGAQQLDYLILGMHYFPQGNQWPSSFAHLGDAESLRLYTKHAIAALESGLFSFVAHADIIGCSYAGRAWDENARSASHDLIQAAVDLKIPLEINGYGIRKKVDRLTAWITSALSVATVLGIGSRLRGNGHH